MSARRWLNAFVELWTFKDLFQGSDSGKAKTENRGSSVGEILKMIWFQLNLLFEGGVEDRTSHPGLPQATISCGRCPSGSLSHNQGEQPGRWREDSGVPALISAALAQATKDTASLRTRLTPASRKSLHVPGGVQVQTWSLASRSPQFCQGGKVSGVETKINA